VLGFCGSKTDSDFEVLGNLGFFYTADHALRLVNRFGGNGFLKMPWQRQGEFNPSAHLERELQEKDRAIGADVDGLGDFFQPVAVFVDPSDADREAYFNPFMTPSFFKQSATYSNRYRLLSSYSTAFCSSLTNAS